MRLIAGACQFPFLDSRTVLLTLRLWVIANQVREFCCLLFQQKGGPQWFKLQEAESGEIQVQFKVSIPGEQVRVILSRVVIC